jgi:hypothetical protein
MAEGKSEEAPLLVTYEGEFHLNTIGSRMLANGNKIHIVLEGDYTSAVMAAIAPLMDKDVKVKFRELVPKKTRKKLGDEDSAHLFGSE